MQDHNNKIGVHELPRVQRTRPLVTYQCTTKENQRASHWECGKHDRSWCNNDPPYLGQQVGGAGKIGIAEGLPDWQLRPKRAAHDRGCGGRRRSAPRQQRCCRQLLQGRAAR